MAEMPLTPNDQPKPVPRKCPNCRYDLAGLPTTERSVCPECGISIKLIPHWMRPVTTSIIVTSALVFVALVFVINSATTAVSNYYFPDSYPDWMELFWLIGALGLWILSLYARIVQPLTEPKLRRRRIARRGTVSAGVVITILGPVGLLIVVLGV